MQVASLELCKTLFELSGWSEPVNAYWYADGLYNEYQTAPETELVSPAYDLGYMLRKLPQPRSLTETYLDPRTLGWKASCREFDGLAETPEDAAAKLCIALFKQGILKREARP